MKTLRMIHTLAVFQDKATKELHNFRLFTKSLYICLLILFVFKYYVNEI